MGWLENHFARNPEEVSDILSECCLIGAQSFCLPEDAACASGFGRGNTAVLELAVVPQVIAVL
jgi:hypothetical protein